MLQSGQAKRFAGAVELRSFEAANGWCCLVYKRMTINVGGFGKVGGGDSGADVWKARLSFSRGF